MWRELVLTALFLIVSVLAEVTKTNIKTLISKISVF